ncbi:MAG: hypothetical protein ACLGH3_03245 [Actinomycetota bacterium]
MPKALYGFAGEPRAAMLLRQVETLRTRVRDLEAALEAAEAELTTLRALREDSVPTTIDLEEGALA